MPTLPKIKISMIAAMSENRVIGHHNQLLWHLPKDLKHFKAKTTGHAVLMGRKTYESIGKPLPNRLNLVMTRAKTLHAGTDRVTSLEEAISVATKNAKQEIFIIGGGEIYQQLLAQTEYLHLTIVHHDFLGDTYFPILDQKNWQILSQDEHPADDENRYHFSLIHLKRIKS